MSTTTPTAENWTTFGTVTIDRDERTIWKYEDNDGRDVFQITNGDEPSSSGGYHELESLLKLKGVKMSDVVTAVSSFRV